MAWPFNRKVVEWILRAVRMRACSGELRAHDTGGKDAHLPLPGFNPPECPQSTGPSVTQGRAEEVGFVATLRSALQWPLGGEEARDCQGRICLVVPYTMPYAEREHSCVGPAPQDAARRIRARCGTCSEESGANVGQSSVEIGPKLLALGSELLGVGNPRPASSNVDAIPAEVGPLADKFRPSSANVGRIRPNVRRLHRYVARIRQALARDSTNDRGSPCW